MPRIRGRILSNNPSYLEGSWLHETRTSAQAELHGQFVDMLADLHRLDWNSLGLGFLVPGGEPDLSAELDRWEEYLAWAADGSPPSVLADTFAWCRENRPNPEPAASVVWGDPGFSNVVFGNEQQPVALLDWELATIAPAEVDLAWFLAMHADAVSRAGADMPGFPERPATVARYEERLGRPIVKLPWFEVFSTACGASCLVRIQKLYVALGVADEEEVARHPGFGDRLTKLMAIAEHES
jgi:aminoglycoside phosphotransferase (APT) family kinase protein